MTDTTDIAALIKSAMLSCAEAFSMEIAGSIENDIGRELTDTECKQVSDAVSRLLDTPEQLKAERQRCAEITEQYVDRTTALSFATQRAEAAESRVGVLEGIIARKEFEALKGDQVPVGKFVFEPSGERWHHIKHGEYQHTEPKLKLVKLFTAPQKPVAIDSDIVLDANRYRFLRDEDAWGEDSDSWDVETRTGLISSENLMGGLSPDHFDAAIDARMAASDIPFLNPITAPQKPFMDQSPSWWVYKIDPTFDGSKWNNEYRATDSYELAKWKDPNCQPLYTHPQKLVVPAEATGHDARMSVGFNRYAQSGYMDGWNACRKAVIEAAGSTVKPDHPGDFTDKVGK